MEEYVKYWKNFVNYEGRATRKEYWMPVLFNFIISIILNMLSSAINVDSVVSLSGIFSIVVFIPNLTIFIRRMHDINKSGWNILWTLLPIIGWIIMFVYLCKETVDEDNRYSKDEIIEDFEAEDEEIDLAVKDDNLEAVEEDNDLQESKA